MNNDVYKLLVAQFLTAFADNAILFTAITMVMNNNASAPWYIPALQASFLVAFVVLAPWVGPFADSRPKPNVLSLANVIKAGGAGLLLFAVEPLLAYAIVGLGAAVYSPAKYGILPELVAEDELVKANGWIEGSTILAILSGTLVGAMASKASVPLALALVIVLYVVSSGIALFIRPTPVIPRADGPVLVHFMNMVRRLLSTPRARFATLGVSLFWSAATVLRVLLVAWAPVVLLMNDTTEIAQLTLFVAFGIAIGAVVAPRLIPMAYLRRARLAAYLMGIAVIGLSSVDSLWTARLALLFIGITGGLFVVPINAALQEIGHKTIGSGGAVGIQNFFENLAMLIASGAYSLAAGAGAAPVGTMLVLGLLILAATFLVSWRLPPDTGAINEP